MKTRMNPKTNLHSLPTALFMLLFGLTYTIHAQNVFPVPANCQRSDKQIFQLTSQTQFEGDKTGVMTGQKELQPYMQAQRGKANTIRYAISVGDELPAEGYTLTVSPDSILLRASDPAGLFYAQQTLTQLARQGKGEIGCCTIKDAPRYGWRGVMLDESRHFFGKEKVKQYLDLMAKLKLNIFHWHLTDETGWRIEIKRYPKLTEVGSIGNWHDPEAAPAFYTQDDIREVVAYAAERQIMVIPEIDMPGHATSACRAYPEVSGGGEGRWQHFTFHPAKENTYDFIRNILEEVAELFPAPYMHIGGDEVHYGNQSWFTDPQIQQFIKENGLTDEKGLEHYFVRRVADIVQDKGKRMIGWDEIVDAGVSPEKAIVMWWRHDRQDYLQKALDNGYQVILTPRRPLYADFVQHETHEVGRRWDGFNPIEDVYDFPEPIAHLFQQHEPQVLGMQMNIWTERIADARRLDFMTFPRMIALAEATWTPLQQKDAACFMKRLPDFLEYLDEWGIYYFNPLKPDERTEPSAPEKEDLLQNG